jgi:phosphoglycerate dehydrogenase-like enzyme
LIFTEARLDRLKGLYALDHANLSLIYGPDEQRDIAARVDIESKAWSASELKSNRSVLKEVDLIFSGWGAPRLDAEFLAAAPKLNVVFYGAGAASGIITEAAWNRQVQATSAYAANAVPVAEYSLAIILFTLKHGFANARTVRELQSYPGHKPAPGAYGSTVGLVSLGMIGRGLLKLLKPFDLHIVVCDPFVSEEESRDLGVKLVSLEELFRVSDVVSLHVPLLKETRGLITGAHIASMKQGATFLNTARGAVVREDELIDVLTRRTDLQAVLDVTDPEPPVKGSPFYTLDNVVLTPHIAGSRDNECRRMGRAMVDELNRYLAGEPLKWAVTPELAKFSSHRPNS